MRPVLIVSVVILLAAGNTSAQGRGASSSKASKPTPVRVTVRAQDGAALSDVRVTLSGDATGSFTTAGAGIVTLPDLMDGSYRARVQRDGPGTLEREFTLRGGTPPALDIVLSAAPPPPAPPPPPPAPAAKALPPPGPSVNLSVIDFLERNFIEKDDPLKESVLACTPLETVRLLQMREPLASHRHADTDEMLYVVAGEGAAHIGDQVVALKAGTMILVPRTMEHSIERRGKNPLMMLSTLAGAPCHQAAESR